MGITSLFERIRIKKAARDLAKGKDSGNLRYLISQMKVSGASDLEIALGRNIAIFSYLETVKPDQLGKLYKNFNFGIPNNVHSLWQGILPNLSFKPRSGFQWLRFYILAAQMAGRDYDYEDIINASLDKRIMNEPSLEKRIELVEERFGKAKDLDQILSEAQQ